jgi:hypothetical protein
MVNMNQKGFVGDSFLSTEKISRKWRYIFAQYKRVKDNNGKTGRNRMKFKYFDMMEELFVDQDSASVVTEPTFIDSTSEEPIQVKQRERRETGEKKSHQQLMREIAKEYNDKSLQLQREALEVEKEKVQLLKQLIKD